MRDVLRLPSLYLGVPMLLACASTWLTYDLPGDYGEGLLLLTMTALGLIAMDLFTGSRLPALSRFRSRHYAGTREGLVALGFAAAVTLFCLLDLLLFPVPLLDKPASYATLEAGREHVRHISDMCWTLPVIGLLCTRQRWLRNVLVVFGFVFPVLVIDRNRIFASLMAFVLVLILRRPEDKPLPWKTILVLAFGGAAAFSLLGILRSGSLDNVALPFNSFYKSLPQGFKWLLLYVSAGPYNFAAILAKHYSNIDILLGQLVPGSAGTTEVVSSIPLDASNINVGTEFFPFLMAWGAVGAVAAVGALYAWLLWSVRRLRAGVSLFSLLIFLRMAYVCVMSPFAPQAFVWMNFGFVLLCLLMQLLAGWLPSRHAVPFSPLAAPIRAQAVLPSMDTHGTR